MTPMQPEQHVAAVILAAGASTRFGSPKQLARIGTRTMLEAVVDAAHAAGLAPVLAVVPSSVAVPPEAVAVPNDEAQLGLSRSLRLGMDAVPHDVAAAVILLGDQPTVDPAHLRRLLARRGERPVVATAAAGIVGPPVLVERRAFDTVGQATGDAGLRQTLIDHPELVARVEASGHPPDVDVPADLEALTEACPGCAARFPALPADGAHAYLGASPACWAAFGEVLAREFGDPAYGWIHRHTVDVYAVQHPGQDDRRQRQSVALHLVGLCHWLEHGMDMRAMNPLTQRLASDDRAWPWLEPPAAYPMTVLDVLEAKSGDEHGRLVRRWAEATWDAWSAHHGQVRAWAREVLQ